MQIVPPGNETDGLAEGAEYSAVERLLFPPGRSTLAILAGHLGLLVWLKVIAPVAVLTGALALLDISRHPEKLGKWRAYFGIAAGLVAILLTAFVTFAPSA